MKIFNGKRLAEKILLKLKEEISKDRIRPALSVISVGKNPASELFIRNKKKAARRIGIKINHYKFKETVSEKEVIRKIEKLNSEDAVNGIIVQLPLPPELSAKKIVGKLSPWKDVDGFLEKSNFSSPLISAILIALKDSTKNFKTQKITALVNSDFFGRALKSSLTEPRNSEARWKKSAKSSSPKKEAIIISYLKNKKRPKVKTADIIITVCGRPNLIKGEMIKKGAILIDGGITVLKNRKVVGDVDKKSLANKARFLTPVPGGLGPLTVALLLENVYYAAKYRQFH